MGKRIGILRPLAWSSTNYKPHGTVNEKTMDKEREEYENSPK
jgi:hypothetical protein